MKKKKVCWISNTPSPYKVAFMNLLGEKTELLCLFEKHSESDRESSWYDYESKNFKAVYLEHGNMRREIRKAALEYDLLINSDYSNPICMYASWVFRRRHKKVCIHADGGLAVPRGMVDKVISFVMKKADFYLSSGLEVNKYFAYYGIPEEQIRLYRFADMNQAELQKASEMAQDKQKYRKACEYTEDVIFLYVGQQIPRKGIDILVQAAKDLPENIGVWIIGGKPEEHVSAYVQEHGLSHVHFLPFMSKYELYEYYAGADVFVLPTRYDIWGLVINEAMAFGLPVISTNRCVAALEFSRDSDSMIITEAENIRALHEAILKLSDDAERRQVMGRAALAKISGYSLENMRDDFVRALTGTQS